RDQLPPPCRRLPVDSTELVVGDVLAQPLELRPFAEPSGVAQPELLGQAAAREQLVLGDLAQVWIDPHGARGLDAGLALPERESGSVAEVEAAEDERAAPRRRQVVLNLGGLARSDAAVEDDGVGGELGRVFVAQSPDDRLAAPVAQPQPNRIRRAEREDRLAAPFDVNLGGLG